MAQKNHLTAFFFAFSSILATLFANNPLHNLSLNSGDNLYCDAPAPEDFEVTDQGQDFVTLGWTPAIAGATHTLLVYQLDTTGGWIQIFGNNSVPGNSYTLYDLPAGSYEARISTNCASGEASIYHAEVSIKIIELTTIGRIPINPVVVTNCNTINYLDNMWVGFRITEIASGRYNFFEFDYANSRVKRVFTPNRPIVATDESGNFPTDIESIFVGEFFKLQDKKYTNLTIGEVIITDLAFPLVGICIKNIGTWNANYRFEALIAESTYPFPPPPQSKINSNSIGGIEHMYLTDYELSIQIPSIKPETSGHLYIYTIDGKIINSQSFQVNNYILKIKTNNLPNGNFIGCLITDDQTFTIRLTKQ
jgi:hypothetical protein